MPRRPSYRVALAHAGILDTLAPFDARVAGTPPLGLAVVGSDIDVLCHAPDTDRFTAVLWAEFRHRDAFALSQWPMDGRPQDGRPVVASFVQDGWRFEIYGAPIPVGQQLGWRHFQVEARLLRLGGPAFRMAVQAARAQGFKTEPAFAAVLALGGDAYQAMDAIADLPDEELAVLLRRTGPDSPRFAKLVFGGG